LELIPQSTQVAAWIAHSAFVVVLFLGWDELWRGRVVFPLLWLFGYFAQSYVPWGPALFPAYVAVIDIVLVFMVFKGDVSLR
jgi:hypothetical protein